MMEEQISKIDKKLEDIETIFETFSASGQSWDEHRRGKVGAFYVYSLDELKEKEKLLREEKKQLREKENLLLAQKASSAGTSPSPRYPNSVFIFGDTGKQDFEPVGTCFAISPRYLLSVQHNLDLKNVKRRTGYAIASTVSKSKSGEINIDGRRDLVVHKYNTEMDYVILKLADSDIGADLLPIPISIRPVEADTDIKVFHCPVGLFNDDAIEDLSVLTLWVKSARPTRHHIICSGGLFAGSSGAPFVVREGFVIGMHVECINSQALIPNDDYNSLEIISETVNSNSHSHASLCRALVFGLCKNLVKELKAIGVELMK